MPMIIGEIALIFQGNMLADVARPVPSTASWRHDLFHQVIDAGSTAAHFP